MDTQAGGCMMDCSWLAGWMSEWLEDGQVIETCIKNNVGDLRESCTDGKIPTSMADEHLISVRLGGLLSILLVEDLTASLMKGLNNTNDLPDGGMYRKRTPEVSTG